MSRRFASIILIIVVTFSYYGHAKEVVRTNQNVASEFFNETIDNKSELEQSLKHAKEQAEKGITDQEGLKSLNITHSEIGNKTTDLNSINAYDLESAGRLERAKEENHYYELLEVDHSAPGQTRHKQDMEQIANASGNLIAKLTEGLKDIGVDCKKTKGNKEVEPQYTIDTEQEHISDITYTKVICEQPRNTYDCAQSLKVSCKQAGDCDRGVISLSSVSSDDIKWEYSYPYLTIGKLATQSWWYGSCDTFDRAAYFQIRSKEEITEFKLAEVKFADYLWIKVNGHTVYLGPKGGHYIEGFFNNNLPIVRNGQGQYECDLTHRCEYKGKCKSTGCQSQHCEKIPSFNFNLDIDLKPYLKEGNNEIWTRVIVGSAGEGWMRIIAKQKCCMSWQEQWSEQCQIK
jgi:hypothetical protein